jgi:hypothetical protein
MIRGRPTLRLPQRGRGPLRGPALVAVVLHVVVVVLVARTISVPVLDFLQRVGSRPVEERVVYVAPAVEPQRPVPAPPPPPPPMGAATRARGAVAPAEPPTAGAGLAAFPTRIDTGAGPPAAGPPLPVGDGRQAFGNGIPGLSTGRIDPRLVLPPGPEDGPVRARTPTADVYVDQWVVAFWDSVAQVQSQQRRNPADWTIGRDGNKWGMDQSFVYFGKFKLPTALLALLPINQLPNPTTASRNAALASMRAEIDFHAQRAANEADFRRAVEEITRRKERERQQAAEQRSQQGAGRAGASGRGTVPPDGR